MYFGVAAVSVLLNFTTMFSYKFGIAKANVASVITSTFSWINLIGNFVVWCVAAGLYRAEKDKNGKSNDLWGWTCSAGARAIQKEFVGDIDFGRYCNVQVSRIDCRALGKDSNDTIAECELVYRYCTGLRCAFDCSHLCLSLSKKSNQEGGAAAIEDEWVRTEQTLNMRRFLSRMRNTRYNNTSHPDTSLAL